MNQTTRHTALALLAAASLAGCARSAIDTTASDNQAYFEDWMAIHHPDAQKKGIGIYILPEDEKTGTGEYWDTGLPCSFITYTVRSLSGTVSSNSDAEMARQLGTYDPADYYGPQVILTGSGVSYAGLDEMFTGMRAGGTRTAVIPYWLMTTSRYGDEAKYLANSSSGNSAIYTITLHGQTDEIKPYCQRRLVEFLRNRAEWESPAIELKDTTTTGIFFKSFTPEKTEAVASDSTVYINYTGRRLDGQVFDTTIERVAKDHGIYVAGKTYAPVPVVWNETATEITLDGVTPVTGFAEGLYQMHQDEHAEFAFTYDKGYSTSGSGTKIPGYASLLFEVELVPAP